MIGKGLVKKLVAGVAAAASAGVAVVALGFTLFYALSLVVPSLAAAAITFGVFAAVTALIAVMFLGAGGDHHDDDEDEEPESIVSKALHLVKDRPILGAAGGLGVLFFLLRNPALAAIVASMVTERRMESRGYRSRRR